MASRSCHGEGNRQQPGQELLDLPGAGRIRAACEAWAWCIQCGETARSIPAA